MGKKYFLGNEREESSRSQYMCMCGCRTIKEIIKSAINKGDGDEENIKRMQWIKGMGIKKIVRIRNKGDADG